MRQFDVPDMECGDCADTVAAAVRRVDGRAGVEVVLADRRVKVRSTAPGRTLAAAIAAAGFAPRPLWTTV